jgi:hypothetical protein
VKERVELSPCKAIRDPLSGCTLLLVTGSNKKQEQQTGGSMGLAHRMLNRNIGCVESRILESQHQASHPLPQQQKQEARQTAPGGPKGSSSYL